MTAHLPILLENPAPPGVPVAVRAEGTRVYDEQGRDYVDGSSGPLCVNLGHGVPEVLAAMQEQASLLCFAHRSQFTTRSVLALTEEILSIAGDTYREVVYTNSGSEAIETALRLAMHHHAEAGAAGRTVVLSQFPSYHGMTAGALGVSGHPPRRENLGPLLDGVVGNVPVTATGHDLLPGFAEWRAAFDRCGPGRVAAVLVEPVGGAASGAAAVPGEVLRGLRGLCNRAGALLVIDEVLTGFGRTGAWFGHSDSGVLPDLVITGKGLSAGYTPIGACLVGERVLPGRSAADLAFGHTMSGNPLSAATALAVLRYTRAHRLHDRAAWIGALLEHRLARLSARFGFLGPPRGRGLLLGLPVRQEPARFAHAPLAKRICAAAQRCGLILYPAGVDHRTQAVLVAPPLTIGEAELELLIDRLADALVSVANEVAVEEGTVG